MEIGDIQRKLCNGSVEFEWTISEFFLILEKRISLMSPQFKHLKILWNLSISRDSFLNYDWIMINLWRCDDTPLKSVWYTIGIRTAMGMQEKILCDEWMGEHVASSGRVKLIQKADLLRRGYDQFPSGKITIICILKDEPPSTAETVVSRETQTEDLPENGSRGEECTYLDTKEKNRVSQETQTEDIPESGAKDQECTPFDVKSGDRLREHFKNLLLDGQDRDVTLKVEDKEFKAHKDILRARSPVFAAMFAHNMKESECGNVTIEDCDSEAFGEFLQFVYTGKADNLTPSNALGLYYASDKYDFPDLKEMCVEYLKASLSTNIICDVISMAMKHSEEELMDCAMEFFTDHLLEILMTVEWQRFLKSNYILANELNIKAMKKLSEKK